MPGPRRIYLDNAATTRPSRRVIEHMAEAQRELFGNPSSPHAFGPPAKRALDDAREFLRGTLSAGRIVFTSGGSEADYLGIIGAAAARAPGRILMSRGDHPALLKCSRLLTRHRHQVSELPVTEHGDLAPETLFEALGGDVRVVALMYGHNELGTLCQLPELIELIRRTSPQAHVHVDLVQTYGKLPFDFDTYDVDSVAVSGHKFHGPRGAGFLALSNEADISPLQEAGGQEGGLRGGTENIAGAVGLMVAAEEALTHQIHSEDHTRDLCERMLDIIHDALPDTERLGHPRDRLPHILSLRIPDVVGETLMLRCDSRGVAFSTGSACSGGHGNTGRAKTDKVKDKPKAKRVQRPKGRPKDEADNHVLAAIGMTRREGREVVRLSVSGETSVADAEHAADVLVEEALRLRDASPSRARPSARANKAGASRS
ncbi:MAG: cysteine desulfurase family protein [Planctomycetota bacterium]